MGAQAEARRQPKPGLVEIDHGHLVHAAALKGERHQQAHRPRAEDERALYRGIQHRAEAVQDAAHGFGERGEGEGHVPDWVEGRGGDDAAFREATILRHAIGAQGLAQMRSAPAAGPAAAAFEVRVDDHARARRGTVRAGAELGDDAGVFVAGHDREGAGAVVGGQHFEIGMADAAGAHLDEGLARARVRVEAVQDRDLSLGGEDDDLHLGAPR